MAKGNRKAKKVVLTDATQTASAAMEQAVAAAMPQPAANEEPGDNIGNSVAPIDRMPEVVLKASAARRPGGGRFAKVSHEFAHKKEGAKRRFQNEYDRIGLMAIAAFNEDLVAFEATVATTAKFNVALTKTQRERMKEMAQAKVKSLLQTVFESWHQEMERIMYSLGGRLQEDQATILFPDGSTAAMPKGLWIDPAKKITI